VSAFGQLPFRGYDDDLLDGFPSLDVDIDMDSDTDTDTEIITSSSTTSIPSFISSGITVRPTPFAHPPQSSLISHHTRTFISSPAPLSPHPPHFDVIPVSRHLRPDALLPDPESTLGLAPVRQFLRGSGDEDQKITLDGVEFAGVREKSRVALRRVAAVLREMIRITREDGEGSILREGGIRGEEWEGGGLSVRGKRGDRVVGDGEGVGEGDGEGCERSVRTLARIPQLLEC